MTSVLGHQDSFEMVSFYISIAIASEPQLGKVSSSLNWLLRECFRTVQQSTYIAMTLSWKDISPAKRCLIIWIFKNYQDILKKKFRKGKFLIILAVCFWKFVFNFTINPNIWRCQNWLLNWGCDCAAIPGNKRQFCEFPRNTFARKSKNG